MNYWGSWITEGHHATGIGNKSKSMVCGSILFCFLTWIISTQVCTTEPQTFLPTNLFSLQDTELQCEMKNSWLMLKKMVESFKRNFTAKKKKTLMVY